MFKQYLKNKNISIYKLAEISKVPYTTINELVNGKKSVSDCKIKTIENLAKALNISIESLLNLLNNKKKILSNTWEENKNKVFYFPVIYQTDEYECNRIHPLKQRKVYEVYQLIKDNKLIEKLILFGSSVNIRCNNNSDIDIALKLKDDAFNKENQNKISEAIQEITEYNTDIIWLNTLDQTTELYKNILTKGVIIYEQIIS